MIQRIVFECRDGEEHSIWVRTVDRPGQGIGGCIEKSLLMTMFLDRSDIKRFNQMIDVLESMVLAHACAGIDIESKEYAEGCRVAYESICNKAFN